MKIAVVPIGGAHQKSKKNWKSYSDNGRIENKGKLTSLTITIFSWVKNEKERIIF